MTCQRLGRRATSFAFRNWIKNQQANEGYGNVRSDDFTRYELHQMLEQAGTLLKRASDGSDRSSGKEIKEDSWLGKPQDWWKKKRELLAYVAKRRNRNGGAPMLDENDSEISMVTRE